jgi:glycerol-3-phosphate acyltransferase PlsX
MSSTINPKCIIAVDAMGGDYAPRNAVLGAIDAFKSSPDFELLLVGKKNSIQEILSENNLEFDSDKIIHAEQIIEMHDSPTTSLKLKSDSSIVVGSKLVKDKKAHAFVSAGNTGAMMAASTLITGRIKGVSRPTMGAALPTSKGGVCYVYDVGASVDSKPDHLFEYAVMASIFVSEIEGVKNPTIGLLSVGEESEKGNEATKAAHKLIKNSNLNFIGNVEGRDVLKGDINIVICDGFVGNILLKFAESVIGLLKGKMRIYADKSITNKLRALLAKGTLKGALTGMDYQEYGGVPLLGINGISIIGHGSSSPLAIKNMILKAKEMYDKNLIQKIEESLKFYTEKNND